MVWRRWPGIFGLCLALAGTVAAGASRLHGFDLSFSLVPRDQIRPGGPPKDGIPALTHPRMVAAEEATYLRNKDLVVGVVLNGDARAYPLRILVWHEVVNDVVGGQPIAVTYCPLCNSAFVFDRQIGGQVREFGVSGLLWNSNLLLYDRQPAPDQESLWSQVAMQAITGPAAQAGLRLTLLPSEMTTWKDWRTRYPTTQVLSIDTGYGRNYHVDPYRRYHFYKDRLMFPVRLYHRKPRGFRLKEFMVVVRVGQRLRAYAVRDIRRAAGTRGFIEDELQGVRFRLVYLPEARSVRVEPLDPKAPLAVAYTYWFALSAMLPDAELFRPQ